MATEEYIVSLGALIDESAVESINTQIKAMQPRLEKVRITIDEMYFNKQLTNIQNQLNRLFKDSDFGKYLSSNLKTVSQEISKTVSDTERQAKRLTESLRNGFVRYAGISDGTKDNTLIDEKKIQKAAQTYFNEINQIGNVTTKVFRNADSEIESFTIDVKNAEGIVEQLRYTLHTIEDEEGNITNAWYAFSNAVGSDNNIKLQEQAMREAEKASKALQTQTERNTAAVTNYNNELEITKRKYLDTNASKPITNADSLNSLQSQYDKVTTAINALGNADKTNFTSLKANVEAEIALLKQMVTEFRNAEYAANQLAAKPINVIKENEAQNIKKLKADIQAAGIESQTFLNKVNELSGKLAGVTNKQQLGEYLNTFSTIKAEFQALSSEQKSQKKQTNDIDNAYKSLKTTIEKIAKLQAQIAGLDSTKNASQITELQSRINELYTEASEKQEKYYAEAKKGGIDFDTTLKNIDTAWKKIDQTVASVNAKTQDTQRNLFASIKGDISGGGLGTSIDTIEAKFRNLNVQSNEIEGNITQLKTLLSQMDGSDDIESVTADYEKFKTLLVTTTNQVKELQISQRQANAESVLTDARTRLSSDIDVWLKNNSAAASKFGAKLKEIQSQIATADKTQLRHLRAEFQDVTKQAQIMGVAGKTAMDRFKDSLRTVTSYFSASMLIMRMISSLRNMYNEVLKVDTAMTGLRRVTNLTGEEYQKMYDDMTESAKKYGSTLDDIINSTASWVRLGFNAQTAEKLSEVTAMYQHVTDLDNSTAVKNLVTAYKGYQNELLELSNGDSVKAMTRISDIYDKLGNEMPVTAAQVGEGMTKAASVLEMAGASFEQATGMITGGGAVTQNFDAFGNALRVSALRIRSMKGELEELGEEVDENISSVSKIQTQILNLTNGKVNIFEADGKSFKNIYDIYADIAKIYNDLSDTDRSSLLELLGGKQRANQIQGMLKRWSDVEEATKKAYEAEGTAAQENEKYMNSMQGKINATKTAWQALANTIMSSDFLKGLIDGGQTFLNIMNGIVKTTGALPPILAVIAGYLSASKNIGIFTTVNNDISSTISGVSTLTNKIGVLGVSFQDLKKTLSSSNENRLFFTKKQLLGNLFAKTDTNTITSMDVAMIKDYNKAIDEGVDSGIAFKNTMFGASTGAKQLANSANGGKISLEGVKVAADGATGSMIGARIATVALQAAITFGIAIAIQGLITLFQKLSKLIPNIENTTEWLKNSANEVKNIQSDINSLNSELTTTKSKIEELQKKPSLTLVEQNELERLKQQNAELQRQIDLKKIALVTAQDANAKEFVKAFNARALHDSSTDKQWYNYAFPFINAFTDTYAMFRGNDSQVYANNLEEFDKYQKEYLAKIEASKNALLNGNTELAKSEDDAAQKAKERMDAKSTELSEYVKGLTEIREQLGEYDYNTLDDETKQVIDYITWVENSLAVRKGYDENVFSSVINSQKFTEGKKAIDQLAESGNLTAESLENLYNSETNSDFNAIIDYLKAVGLIADTSTNSFELLANQIKSTNNSVDENGNAIDTTTEKVDRFKELMDEKGTDKNPSFVEGIEKSVEQLQKLEDALVKFESGTLTDKEKTSLFKAFPQLTAYANNLGAGIRNLLGEMRGDIVTQFTDKIVEFKQAGATDEEIAQLKTYEQTILNIADSVDSVKNALDSMKSVFKDLDSVIKDYNENQYFSLESLEKLGENGQRYLSYLSYENGQLKINEEAYKKLVLAQIDEIETKATLQATTDLQSLTDETTAKEYLAKVNIDLAQSQLTAAQAAFQYQLALKLAEGGNVAKAAQKVADNLNSLRNIFASARGQVDDYAAAMLGATSATEKKAKASEKAKDALEKEQRALEHSKKALEDEKKALEDTKDEYEKAQKAIEDLIKWTQDYIKQIKEDEVKALEEKKDKFDELIEKQKETLQAEKDLHDYEKSVGEKQNDLASNALKVSVSSLDDSGAGKKAYKKAQEEYKKSQVDMEDFLYDHSIETREEALDKLKEDTDKSYEEQIKTIQDYLSNEVQLYRDACSMIDNDNGDLYGKLLNYCLTYTTTGKNEFDRMWSLAQTAMEKYNVASIGTMQFMDELKGRMYEVDDAIDTISKNIETYENRISDVKIQLDNLKDAAIQAKNAIDVANSTPLKGDASKSPNNSDNGMRYIGRGYDAAKGQYYYKVSYRGRDYWGYVGDSSDTDRVRNLASLNISKEIAKYHSGFDIYGLSQVQHALGVNVKNLGHYASGTRSTPPAFISQEKGLEAIFAKNPNGGGSYTLTTPDSQVFDHKRTDELYDFSGNPSEYIKDNLIPLSQDELSKFGAWGDLLQIGSNDIVKNSVLNGLTEKIVGGLSAPSNKTVNNMATNVNITIQGDATQSTVNALKAEANKIVARAKRESHNDFVETVLKGRKWR